MINFLSVKDKKESLQRRHDRQQMRRVGAIENRNESFGDENSFPTLSGKMLSDCELTISVRNKKRKEFKELGLPFKKVLSLNCHFLYKSCNSK
jgi:hypothetical protein